jgi:hypothetical protein
MDESKKLINNQSQQDSLNNYYSINIPESHNTNLYQKPTVIITKNNREFKRNVFLTFLTLLIVIILCFCIIGIFSFVDILKADEDLNDDY